MENLFRLMLSRPAVAQDPQNPSVELAQTPARGAQVAVRQGKEMLAVGGGVFSAERGRTVAVARVDALWIDEPDALRAPARTRLPG